MALRDSQNKIKAIALRRKGLSIGFIEKRLGINRSTLSGWFKNVELTAGQKKKLFHQWQNGLVKARIKAVQWHNEQKVKRLAIAKEESDQVIKRIDFRNNDILELAMAMLYLGEGFKGEYTGMANSDPLIMRSFVSFLIKDCVVPTNKIRCSLYLRADQDFDRLRKFWSKELNLPIANFRHGHSDQRTLKSKTWENYKGVCAISCGNVAIQRRLVNIGRMFCERIAKRL